MRDKIIGISAAAALAAAFKAAMLAGGFFYARHADNKIHEEKKAKRQDNNINKALDLTAISYLGDVDKPINDSETLNNNDNNIVSQASATPIAVDSKNMANVVPTVEAPIKFYFHKFETYQSDAYHAIRLDEHPEAVLTLFALLVKAKGMKSLMGIKGLINKDNKVRMDILRAAAIKFILADKDMHAKAKIAMTNWLFLQDLIGNFKKYLPHALSLQGYICQRYKIANIAALQTNIEQVLSELVQDRKVIRYLENHALQEYIEALRQGHSDITFLSVLANLCGVDFTISEAIVKSNIIEFFNVINDYNYNNGASSSTQPEAAKCVLFSLDGRPCFAINATFASIIAINGATRLWGSTTEINETTRLWELELEKLHNNKVQERVNLPQAELGSYFTKIEEIQGETYYTVNLSTHPDSMLELFTLLAEINDVKSAMETANNINLVRLKSAATRFIFSEQKRQHKAKIAMIRLVLEQDIGLDLKKYIPHSIGIQKHICNKYQSKSIAELQSCMLQLMPELLVDQAFIHYCNTYALTEYCKVIKYCRMDITFLSALASLCDVNVFASDAEVVQTKVDVGPKIKFLERKQYNNFIIKHTPSSERGYDHETTSTVAERKATKLVLFNLNDIEYYAINTIFALDSLNIAINPLVEQKHAGYIIDFELSLALQHIGSEDNQVKKILSAIKVETINGKTMASVVQGSSFIQYSGNISYEQENDVILETLFNEQEEAVSGRTQMPVAAIAPRQEQQDIVNKSTEDATLKPNNIVIIMFKIDPRLPDLSPASCIALNVDLDEKIIYITELPNKLSSIIIQGTESYQAELCAQYTELNKLTCNNNNLTLVQRMPLKVQELDVKVRGVEFCTQSQTQVGNMKLQANTCMINYSSILQVNAMQITTALSFYHAGSIDAANMDIESARLLVVYSSATINCPSTQSRLVAPLAYLNGSISGRVQEQSMVANAIDRACNVAPQLLSYFQDASYVKHTTIVLNSMDNRFSPLVIENFQEVSYVAHAVPVLNHVIDSVARFRDGQKLYQAYRSLPALDSKASLPEFKTWGNFALSHAAPAAFNTVFPGSAWIMQQIARIADIVVNPARTPEGKILQVSSAVLGAVRLTAGTVVDVQKLGSIGQELLEQTTGMDIIKTMESVAGMISQAPNLETALQGAKFLCNHASAQFKIGIAYLAYDAASLSVCKTTGDKARDLLLTDFAIVTRGIMSELSHLGMNMMLDKVSAYFGIEGLQRLAGFGSFLGNVFLDGTAQEAVGLYRQHHARAEHHWFETLPAVMQVFNSLAMNLKNSNLFNSFEKLVGMITHGYQVISQGASMVGPKKSQGAYYMLDCIKLTSACFMLLDIFYKPQDEYFKKFIQLVHGFDSLNTALNQGSQAGRLQVIAGALENKGIISQGDALALQALGTIQNYRTGQIKTKRDLSIVAHELENLGSIEQWNKLSRDAKVIKDCNEHGKISDVEANELYLACLVRNAGSIVSDGAIKFSNELQNQAGANVFSAESLHCYQELALQNHGALISELIYVHGKTALENMQTGQVIANNIKIDGPECKNRGLIKASRFSIKNGKELHNYIGGKICLEYAMQGEVDNFTNEGFISIIHEEPKPKEDNKPKGDNKTEAPEKNKQEPKDAPVKTENSQAKAEDNNQPAAVNNQAKAEAQPENADNKQAQTENNPPQLENTQAEVDARPQSESNQPKAQDKQVKALPTLKVKNFTQTKDGTFVSNQHNKIEAENANVHGTVEGGRFELEVSKEFDHGEKTFKKVVADLKLPAKNIEKKLEVEDGVLGVTFTNTETANVAVTAPIGGTLGTFVTGNNVNLENKSLIDSDKGATSIHVANVDNRDGDIHGATLVDVKAKEILNNQEQLTDKPANIDGAATKVQDFKECGKKGIVSEGSMLLQAEHVNNRCGNIVSAGDTHVDIKTLDTTGGKCQLATQEGAVSGKIKEVIGTVETRPTIRPGIDCDHVASDTSLFSIGMAANFAKVIAVDSFNPADAAQNAGQYKNCTLLTQDKKAYAFDHEGKLVNVSKPYKTLAKMTGTGRLDLPKMQTGEKREIDVADPKLQVQTREMLLALKQKANLAENAKIKLVDNVRPQDITASEPDTVLLTNDNMVYMVKDGKLVQKEKHCKDLTKLIARGELALPTVAPGEQLTLDLNKLRGPTQKTLNNMTVQHGTAVPGLHIEKLNNNGSTTIIGGGAARIDNIDNNNIELENHYHQKIYDVVVAKLCCGDAAIYGNGALNNTGIMSGVNLDVAGFNDIKIGVEAAYKEEGSDDELAYFPRLTSESRSFLKRKKTQPVYKGHNRTLPQGPALTTENSLVKYLNSVPHKRCDVTQESLLTCVGGEPTSALTPVIVLADSKSNTATQIEQLVAANKLKFLGDAGFENRLIQQMMVDKLARLYFDAGHLDPAATMRANIATLLQVVPALQQCKQNGRDIYVVDAVAFRKVWQEKNLPVLVHNLQNFSVPDVTTNAAVNAPVLLPAVLLPPSVENSAVRDNAGLVQGVKVRLLGDMASGESKLVSTGHIMGEKQLTLAANHGEIVKRQVFNIKTVTEKYEDSSWLFGDDYTEINRPVEEKFSQPGGVVTAGELWCYFDALLNKGASLLYKHGGIQVKGPVTMQPNVDLHYQMVSSEADGFFNSSSSSTAQATPTVQQPTIITQADLNLSGNELYLTSVNFRSLFGDVNIIGQKKVVMDNTKLEFKLAPEHYAKLSRTGYTQTTITLPVLSNIVAQNGGVMILSPDGHIDITGLQAASGLKRTMTIAAKGEVKVMSAIGATHTVGKLSGMDGLTFYKEKIQELQEFLVPTLLSLQEGGTLQIGSQEGDVHIGSLTIYGPDQTLAHIYAPEGRSVFIREQKLRHESRTIRRGIGLSFFGSDAIDTVLRDRSEKVAEHATAALLREFPLLIAAENLLKSGDLADLGCNSVVAGIRAYETYMFFAENGKFGDYMQGQVEFKPRLRFSREQTVIKGSEAAMLMIKTSKVYIEAGKDIIARGIQINCEDFKAHAGRHAYFDAAVSDSHSKSKSQGITVGEKYVGIDLAHQTQDTLTHQNTHITASNSAEIIAGEDVYIRGAVIKAAHTFLKAKRLFIQSCQDAITGRAYSYKFDTDGNAAVKRSATDKRWTNEQTRIEGTESLIIDVESGHNKGASIVGPDGPVKPQNMTEETLQDYNKSSSIGFSGNLGSLLPKSDAAQAKQAKGKQKNPHNAQFMMPEYSKTLATRELSNAGVGPVESHKTHIKLPIPTRLPTALPTAAENANTQHGLQANAAQATEPASAKIAELDDATRAKDMAELEKILPSEEKKQFNAILDAALDAGYDLKTRHLMALEIAADLQRQAMKQELRKARAAAMTKAAAKNPGNPDVMGGSSEYYSGATLDAPPNARTHLTSRNDAPAANALSSDKVLKHMTYWDYMVYEAAYGVGPFISKHLYQLNLDLPTMARYAQVKKTENFAADDYAVNSSVEDKYDLARPIGLSDAAKRNMKLGAGLAAAAGTVHAGSKVLGAITATTAGAAVVGTAGAGLVIGGALNAAVEDNIRYFELSEEYDNILDDPELKQKVDNDLKAARARRAQQAGGNLAEHARDKFNNDPFEFGFEAGLMGFGLLDIIPKRRLAALAKKFHPNISNWGQAVTDRMPFLRFSGENFASMEQRMAANMQTNTTKVADKLTKEKLIQYMEHIHEVPRWQLIRDMESIGLKIHDKSPNNRFLKFSHKTKDIRVEIHAPHPDKRGNGAKYPHIHITDKQGRYLDKKLAPVPRTSEAAHIKIQDLSNLLLEVKPKWTP